MYVADLKGLAEKHGLEKGTKESMVKDLLAFEANVREEERARDAKIKQIEKKIKDDLKATCLPDLKELCRSIYTVEATPKGGTCLFESLLIFTIFKFRASLVIVFLANQLCRFAFTVFS